MVLPKYIKSALNLLERAGYKAYLVGGAVRDMIMGNTPSDYDICTDARPDDIKRVFCDNKTIDIGERFGTVGVIIGKATVEITTFRSDAGYDDLRHPAEVRFSDSLKEDLRRRDFTVNAIAYNEKEGIIDPFLGQRDIRRKIIRAVGNAETRFSEDALRIMRAVRFCAVLGFTMEDTTRLAAEQLAKNLAKISPERVRDELLKLIVAKNSGSCMLENKAVLFEVIPELKACDGFRQDSPYHCYDVLEHITHTVDYIDNKPVLRIAALFHDIGKPECYSYSGGRGHFYGHMEKSAEIARNTLTRLHFPNKFTDTVVLLVENHDKPYSPTPEDARRWLSRIGADNVYLIIRHKTADCLAHDRSYASRLSKIRAFRKEVDMVLKRNDCYTMAKLAVGGNDIKSALGINGGELTGEILRYLLDGVIDGRIKNVKSELLASANEYLGDQ